MYKKVYKELIGKLGEGLLEDEFSLEFAEELEQVMRKYEPNKIRELFEKMVNITYQAQAQGEIGMVTGERIDKVVKEYEEYCNQEERKKLVSEAKDILDEVHKDLSTKNLETVNNLISIGNKINKVDEYLDEIQKYNVVCKE